MPNRGLRVGAARSVTATLLFALAIAPAQAQQAPPVAVATAATDRIVREITLTGSLSSPRRAELAPEVADRVTAVLAEAGDRVAAGTPLLRLDDALSRIELRQAEAALREAQANLADARRRQREAEDLAARRTIGQSELESRRAAARQAEAVVARREAERDFRAELLDRHTLNAPFDGVVNRRMIEVGERATPDNPVFELVAIERLRLDLDVPQQHFGAVTTQTAVRVLVDARPDEVLEGRIDTVVPVSDESSRTFHARLDLDNSAGRLTPGMSARATLRIDTGRSGVVIPQDALIRHPDGRTVVWIAEGEGDTRTVREQRVRTGLKFDGRIAVLDGLGAGTVVVTEGNEALQSDQQVRVTRTE
ncbi:MAG: efflux RND transporter periplasmic adaptor subunit [Candidatus Competibacterales bacterium]|nr:efflux RND transporter periplasmic adaptor subunit [Candidatus Competibacterales bacterium]